MRDANGKPVPKAIRKQKGKILRFLLEWWRPDKWGKHRKIDVPHNGGVLVVGGISHAIPKGQQWCGSKCQSQEVEGGAEDDWKTEVSAVVGKSQMALSVGDGLLRLSVTY